MVGKLFKAGMSVVLAVGLSVPLAACQQGQKVSSVEVENESDDNRWADFDDGSEVLSLDTPFFHSNADELNFNVTLEQGTLARDVDAADVTLSGALDGWQVDSAGRADDVTIAVKASRPEGLANNGASVATVSVKQDVVSLPDANEGTEATLQETDTTSKEMTSEEINEENGVEWPEGAVIVNEDRNAEDADQTSGETVETTSAEGAESDEADGTYGVIALFVDLTLTVDFGRSQLDGTTFKVLLVANDLTFYDDIAASSFALEDADGCSVADARRVSSTEVEVSIALPAEHGIAALEGALLTLNADANESGASVSCFVEVPEPWLELDIEYTNEEAGEVLFNAKVHNGSGALTADNMSVTVGGEEKKPKAVSANADGSYTVTLAASDVGIGDVVTLDADGVANEIGQNVDVKPTATTAELDGDSRGLTGSELADDLLKSAGKAGLAALGEYGWSQLCKSFLDPECGTSLYEVTNNELMSEVVKAQGQLTDISNQISALSNTVVTGQNETVINNANDLVNTVSTEVLQLRDGYSAVCKKSDPAEREKALKDFAHSSNNVGIINDLATNLGKLYGVIVKASPKDNRDIISVYDELMARSYNWGAQTYENRQSFRNALASTWANGAQIVALAYGCEDSEGARRETYLNNLDRQTKEISKLINQTHAIDSSSYRYMQGKTLKNNLAELGAYKDYTDSDYESWIIALRYSDEDEDEDEDEEGLDTGKALAEALALYEKYKAIIAKGDSEAIVSYYCHTTGKWYRAYTPADRWSTDWNWGNNPKHSPFEPNAGKSWNDVYLNTGEAKQIAAKLRDGQTLKSELEGVGFTTAEYLVTSERHDDSYRVATLKADWHFDTFEVAKADNRGNGYTRDKEHMHAVWYLDLIMYHVSWYINPTKMFTLKMTEVSKK